MLGAVWFVPLWWWSKCQPPTWKIKSAKCAFDFAYADTTNFKIAIFRPDVNQICILQFWSHRQVYFAPHVCIHKIKRAKCTFDSTQLFWKYEGGVTIEKLKKQLEPTDKTRGIPGFQYEDHAYQLLNLGLDIEADGIIYHLSSQFVGESEMGAVLDLIELERNRRNSA